MRSPKKHSFLLSILAALAIMVALSSCAQGTTPPATQDPDAPNLVGTWTGELSGFTYTFTFTSTTYNVDMTYNGSTTPSVETGTYTITSTRFKTAQTYPDTTTTNWYYTYSNDNGVESFYYNTYYLTKQ